ncbi:MAG TPA: glycoside hydrolase, partial [Rikenellaceae bacterium]|nr:glycoside hydrolase [Rikenellaceae bacterium]
MSLVTTASAQTFHLNDLEYFETRGANVLVYNNQYAGIFADEKKAGVEMILRGVRVATGGGIRLTDAPEQWDVYPEVVNRTVDKSTSTISTTLSYADYDFTSVIKVSPQGNGVVVSVVLDKPVPSALEGKAGLNLEFFPASYFGTNFMMDGRPQILPHHPAGDTRMRPYSDRVPQFYGLSTFDDRGRKEYIEVQPMAVGHKLVMAPERDDLMVS